MKSILSLILSLAIALPAFGQSAAKLDQAAKAVQPPGSSPEPVAAIARGLIDGSGNVVANAVSGTLALAAGTTIGGSSVAVLGTITSSSATALAVGRQGATQPAFQVDASTSSSITGIKLTAAASGNGVALAALGGTNEAISIDGKGSGALKLNFTGTGDILVGDGTNPSFQVVHTSEGTGVKVTSAAAASGVAVAAISSGTDENMKIDAKGAGTLTLNGTATGATIVTKRLGTDFTEVVTGTNVITAAESGSVFFIDNATGFVSTLPAPAAGLHFTFINRTANTSGNHTIVTNSSANIIKGNQNSVAGDAGDNGTADDTISFVANQSVAGDKVELWCDGTSWFAYAISRVAAGITFTQAN